MLPQKAIDVFKSLLQTVGEFKSPAYRSFFTRKANEDFEDLKIKSNNGTKKCVVEKYLDTQKDLIDVMKRQTVIYNMFYDDRSGI